ncbi:O-antigen ligase [Sulfurimonas sp.]|uniref:O-antigen ligase family protein n=1 Tax=Sulfurimonas sp. TaxID=2022749 RepID=UPI0025E96440|nr:O-antigen ligase family protein [Sulfurimonas sp.]MCK9455056.1 O-antigen ligase family protein [Sulfurimonas sp.]
MTRTKRDYLVYYIYFFIFITPLNTFKSQLFITTTLLLIGWLLTFDFKENRFIQELKKLFSFPPFLLIALFFLLNFISFLWSSNIKDWLHIQSFFKYYLIIIPVLATTLTADEAKNAFKIFLVSLTFYAIFTIMIYLGLLTVTKTPEDPFGTLAYSVATPFMVIGFFCAIVLSLYEKNQKIKYIFYMIAVMFFIAIFIQNGRAGQLAFFGTLFMLMIIYSKKLISLKSTIFVVIVVILSLSAIHFLGKDKRFIKGFNEVKLLVEKGEFKGSWGARAYVWSGAIEGVKENPFLGVGAGGNIDYILEFQKNNPFYSDSTVLATHNLHVDILFKYGIFGYTLFIGSIILLILALSQKEEKLFGLLGVVFFSTILFSSLGDDMLIIKPVNNVFINIFILLSVIVIKKSPEKRLNT